MSDQSPPSRVVAAIEDVREALARGEQFQVEVVVQRYPEVGQDPEALLQVISEGVRLRCEAGETPEADEYYPWLPNAELRDELDLLVEFHRHNRRRVQGSEADGAVSLPSRYTFLGTLGSGGIGVVYRVRDARFGRMLAVKTLKPEFRHDDQHRRRLVLEAEVMGRLQHPGIPPVHELSRLGDGTPFVAMKLIDGQTLAETLIRSGRDAENLNEHLRDLETVSQAVAYAHANGIIHRDLKPANIMKGAFGEVQVMDWGLARAIGPTAATDDGPADPTVETVYLDGSSMNDAECLTRPGSVVGTLPYMAPEQAAGRRSEVGPAADVFSLGSILCEILTGAPAYRLAGRTNAEQVRIVAGAELGDAYRRLDECRQAAALIDLARSCLSPEPERRPADAGRVADRFAEYFASLERERATAVRQRLVAETRADGERKRRHLIVMLGIPAVALVFFAADVYRWQYQTRQFRQDRISQTVDGLLDRFAEERSRSRWSAATTLLESAESHVDGESHLDLREQLRRARCDLEVSEDLESIRRKRIWSFDREDFDPTFANGRRGEYAKTFSAYHAWRRFGRFDEGNVDFSDVAEVMSQPDVPADVRHRLIAALDDWALHETDETLRDELLAIARTADPDPERDRLRDAANWDHRGVLTAMARRAEIAEFSPTNVRMLAELLLHRHGAKAEAARLLDRACVRHPTDFWLQFTLGSLLSFNPVDSLAALGHLQAATAIQPDAIAVQSRVGGALSALGRYQEAEMLLEEVQEVAKLVPTALNKRNLAVLHKNSGRPTEAEAAFREAIRIDAGDARLHVELAELLESVNRYVDAETEYREAIRKAPQELPQAYFRLGLLLLQRGRKAEAKTALQGLIHLKPQDAKLHWLLGVAWQRHHETAEACDAFRRAVELDPNHLLALNNLAWLQATSPDDAIRDGRSAVALAARARDLVELSGSEQVFDTLAAAHAEAGDFEQAVEYAARLASAVPSNKRFQDRLALYRSGRPFREATPPLDQR